MPISFFFQDWMIDCIVVPIASGYGLANEYHYLKNSIKEYLTGIFPISFVYIHYLNWIEESEAEIVMFGKIYFSEHSTTKQSHEKQIALSVYPLL